MKIESTDHDIRTLLASGYYRIPRFQRPYSWDSENIQEFWEDVVRDKHDEYFIGSMVVYIDGKQKFGVVDGQQRLTTITIFLCALRNALQKLGHKDLALGVHGMVERKNIDNTPEFIVSTETSYPYFQDSIQKFGVAELKIEPLKEELRLEAAFKQIEKLLADSIKSIDNNPTLKIGEKKQRILDQLIKIRDSLLSLKLIFVKLTDEDDAYLIFETLNTRGKDLNLTDLVKNHLTKHLKKKNPKADATKVKWHKLLETIEGSSVDLTTDDFIHRFWLSKFDYLPARKLFKVLKKQVDNKKAAEFLDILLEDAALYRLMYETNFASWKNEEAGVKNSLDALMLFRVQQQIPTVLSLLREYKISKKIKKKHIEEALLAIEKFHFLFTAATSQRSSGGISFMYANFGRRLYEAKDTQQAVIVIQELKQKLAGLIPSIEEVRALFPNILYTNNLTRSKKLVKYILVSMHKQNPASVVADYDKMTIEHLASQSLIGKEDFTEEVIGQLGNLLLIPENLNGLLDDKPFLEKKKILLKHGVKLPDAISKATSWTKDNISKRTLEMADLSYQKIWKL